MNKLPREARDFLALVADAHDPPDELARQRVHARLSALTLLPATRPHAQLTPDLAAHAGTRAAGGWFASSKALLAGALALVLGGALWSLSPARQLAPAPRRASHEPAAPSLAAGEAPPSAAQPLPPAPLLQQAEVVSAPIPLGAAPAPARPARLQHATESASSLAEEAALLHRAGEQLARRDLEGAQRLLEAHRRRYHGSQLAEERAGLSLLARCLRDPRAGAEQARAFVARSPGSLLVPRLVSACAL